MVTREFDFMVGMLAVYMPEDTLDWLFSVEPDVEWTFFKKSILNRIPEDWPLIDEIMETLDIFEP